MADDLHALIRVRKHTVEQKQKLVSDLYRKAEELKAERETILGQLEEERAKAHEMGVEMLSYLGPYTEAVQDRVEEIEKQERTLEARIQIAQEDMRAAFAELKKIEITQRNREDAEKKEFDKKEGDELDAIAIEAYCRKLAEED